MKIFQSTFFITFLYWWELKKSPQAEVFFKKIQNAETEYS